jgi:hypothetical protein
MQGMSDRPRVAAIAIVALGFWGQAQAVQARPPLVTRVPGIATGLAACWRPAHDDDQVTVRMSFTRDGAVIGEPRIVFVQSSGGAADDLGSAIAGRFWTSASLAEAGRRSLRRRDGTPAVAAPSSSESPSGMLRDCTNRFTGFSRVSAMF